MTARWVRQTLPDEGDGVCLVETLDIGPFTIDAYESGWENEGYQQGKAGSMLHAKHHALLAAHTLLIEWTAQIDAALRTAERRLRARERNQGEP